jgi:hypothetical protein
MMRERIWRCPNCSRETDRTGMSYVANRFCNQCLPDRMQKMKDAIGPVENRRTGMYSEAIPVRRKSA